jgi:hypothetical protein
MGSGSNGYHLYSVLIDLGATYAFVFQAVADYLGLEVVTKQNTPSIAFVNSEPLRTTAIVRKLVHMHDSNQTKQRYAIAFVITDIAHYVLLPSIVWLQKHNSSIAWDTGVWQCHTRTDAEDGPMCLASAGAFVASMCTECT